MDYKELEDVDVKLHLLSGSTMRIGNIDIKPYKMSEIKDYGYTNYMDNLKWMSISKDDFIDSTIEANKREVFEEKGDKLKAFDFYVKLSGHELLEKLLESLRMIFRTDDVMVIENNVIALNFVKMGIFYEEDGELIVDDEILSFQNDSDLTVIHRDNFDDIVEVVKLQNYLSRPTDKKDDSKNPVDEETKKLIEEMELNKKRVDSKKQAQKSAQGVDEKSIDISDILSAVSSKSNSINKLNIWELTLYEVYDEYSRLELIDSYDFNIRAIMAGAKDIDLTHWSSKL